MRTITVFNFLSLNGFYKGLNEDISWHRHGPEENDYAGDAAQEQNALMFGRVTYEMMYSYWPSEMATKNSPRVADGMNKAPKIVFSNSLKKANWHNTSIITGDIITETKKIKQQSGPNITILGSGSIVRQLADHDLIDHYSFMIDPVVLGAGSTIFGDINKKLDLELLNSKVFRSGVLLVNYKTKNSTI
ncbi:MAG: dihydrofolate reductase family protein [Chryseolinea sp.]